MEIFTWKINTEDFSETTKFDVREVQFGDGYQQIQRKGLRTKKREWDASITAKKATIEMIVAFFDRHGGVQSFRWRDATVRVAEYNVKPLGGIIYKISFKFKEV